jgi:hypothetical protein
MLILMSAVLAFIGLKASKRHGISPMVAGLVGAATLSLTTGGIGLVNQVQAINPVTSVTDADVDTPIPFSFGGGIYENQAGFPLEVESLEVTAPGCTLATSGTPTPCSEGLRIENGAQCEVDLLCET